MSKYLTAYAVSLQEALQLRWTLAMDRLRGLALVVSLYYLWSTLLAGRDAFLGYTASQMVTYVLGMGFLRALVLSGKGWDMIHEISEGKLSAYLVRPVNYFGFQFARELAEKTLLAASALVEIAVLAVVFGASLYAPGSAWTLAQAAAAAALALVLSFLLEMLLCTSAFWTAESMGPLFAFEMLLQFAAGAFFPLDVLPESVQAVLRMTPFPYLVFFPLEIYLDRAQNVGAGLAVMAAWILILSLLLSRAWAAGLKDYAAEGG